MQSISLADELTLELAGARAGEDEIVCAALPGPPSENLAWRALREFRARSGWRAPPLRLTIDKAIPVAAGLAGGSADAAAALRLARHASGLGDERLLVRAGRRARRRRARAGAPGRWLAGGAGERLLELPGAQRSLACSCCRWTPSSPRPRSTPRPTGSASPAARRRCEERRRALLAAWTGPDGARCRRRAASCCTTTCSGPPSRSARDRRGAARGRRRRRGPRARQRLRARPSWGCSPANSASGPAPLPRTGALARARQAAAALAQRSPAAICAVPVDASSRVGRSGS